MDWEFISEIIFALLLVMAISLVRKKKSGTFSLLDSVEFRRYVEFVFVDQGYGGAANRETISQVILRQITRMNFILVREKVAEDGAFKIEIKNYEFDPDALRRQPTFIQLTGSDKSPEITYTTSSLRYEYGQDKHNNTVAMEFLNAVKSRLAAELRST